MQNANSEGLIKQRIRWWWTICNQQICSKKTNSSRGQQNANKWKNGSKVPLKRGSWGEKILSSAGCGLWQVECVGGRGEAGVEGCLHPAAHLKQNRALTRIPSITQPVTSVTWQAKLFPVKTRKYKKRSMSLGAQGKIIKYDKGTIVIESNAMHAKRR